MVKSLLIAFLSFTLGLHMDDAMRVVFMLNAMAWGAFAALEWWDNRSYEGD